MLHWKEGMMDNAAETTPVWFPGRHRIASRPGWKEELMGSNGGSASNQINRENSAMPPRRGEHDLGPATPQYVFQPFDKLRLRNVWKLTWVRR
jgi:hypothetical protein